jgi:hypothetical protein
MVVNNFDLLRISIAPNETDAPSVVDADAVLACPVAAQGFQAIAWRSSEIAQFDSLVQLPQLALANPLHILWQAPREPTMEQRLGVAIGERADHASHYIRGAFLSSSLSVATVH